MRRKCFYILFIIFISGVFKSCITSYKYSYEEDIAPSFKGDHRNKKTKINQTVSEIKVISFNIEFARNIKEAVTLLGQEPLNNADVILLQEMDDVGTETLARSLKLNYIYYPAIYHPKHKKNVGNAILTKWEIKSSKKVKLPHPSSYPVPYQGRNYKFRKTATVADIEINGQLINFASTHAAAFNTTQKRKEFAEAVIEEIDVAQPLYSVVGGDFNSLGLADINATSSSFTNSGYEWASQDIGITVSEKKSVLKSIPSDAFQLDHLFVKGLKVKEVGKVEQIGVSDHLPIWVKLRVSQK